eukprot:scaffold1301_cov128-Cylindrotheca_fusiformis.AAC.7
MHGRTTQGDNARHWYGDQEYQDDGGSCPGGELLARLLLHRAGLLSKSEPSGVTNWQYLNHASNLKPVACAVEKSTGGWVFLRNIITRHGIYIFASTCSISNENEQKWSVSQYGSPKKKDIPRN